MLIIIYVICYYDEYKIDSNKRVNQIIFVQCKIYFCLKRQPSATTIVRLEPMQQSATLFTNGAYAYPDIPIY